MQYSPKYYLQTVYSKVLTGEIDNHITKCFYLFRQTNNQMIMFRHFLFGVLTNQLSLSIYVLDWR